MNLKALNIIWTIVTKLLPKVADGNLRRQLQAEIEKLEIEFRMQIKWVIGVIVIMIFANFMYQSITNSGFLLNIDTPIETLQVILILSGIKVVTGISFIDLYKAYKSLRNKKKGK